MSENTTGVLPLWYNTLLGGERFAGDQILTILVPTVLVFSRDMADMTEIAHLTNHCIFSDPYPCLKERDRWVLALSALSAMSRFQKQFVQGGVAQVREATTSFIQGLKRDFTDSQR